MLWILSDWTCGCFWAAKSGGGASHLVLRGLRGQGGPRRGHAPRAANFQVSGTIGYRRQWEGGQPDCLPDELGEEAEDIDRKSTRLNSSHLGISYAVFCLK